ncbi:MAG: helix-hairpin-helix domain-containing protein [Ferruginibacter sp.]
MARQNKNHYLHFTKKERNGTSFLLVIILLVAIIPILIGVFFKKEIPNVLDYTNDIAALKQKEKENAYKKYDNNATANQHEPYNSNKVYNNSPVTLHPFYFDPNTLPADGWKKIGLREKTIATILNFVGKGGKFKSPEDIKKIWGLKTEEAEQLVPWIKIAATENTSERKFEAPFTHTENKRPIEIIDINIADSATWESLPGIGSKLSQRIVNFRNKLGGFYTVDQVGETFGLPDSTFQFIKQRLNLTHKDIKKININIATLDELKAHPYIRYHLANAIVQYRTQHGNFTQPEDLKKIMLIDETVYSKITPYITIND